jgi:hypothetical protein
MYMSSKIHGRPKKPGFSGLFVGSLQKETVAPYLNQAQSRGFEQRDSTAIFSGFAVEIWMVSSGDASSICFHTKPRPIAFTSIGSGLG